MATATPIPSPPGAASPAATQSSDDGPRPLNDELAPKRYESVASESFIDIGISGGGHHVCGLRRDGTVACWTGPDSDYHELSPPDGESFDSISMGWAHGCGLRRDGTIGCWGQDESDGWQPPQDERLVQISSGQYHTCGLRYDGTAICWGVKRVSGSYVPEPHNDETFIAISSGNAHTCALRQDRSPACWGAPGKNVGILSNFGQASPPKDDRFVAIDAGLFHTCALREDGSAALLGCGRRVRHAVRLRAGVASKGRPVRRDRCRPLPHLRPPGRRFSRLLGSRARRQPRLPTPLRTGWLRSVVSAGGREVHSHRQRCESHLRPEGGWLPGLLRERIPGPELMAPAQGEGLHCAEHVKPWQRLANSSLRPPTQPCNQSTRRWEPAVPIPRG